MLKYLLSLSFLGLTINSTRPGYKGHFAHRPKRDYTVSKIFSSSVKIANEGIFRVGNFYGGVYLSKDDKFDGEFYDPFVGYFYTGSWDPGTTYDVPIVPTAPVLLEPGKYHLIIVVDTNGDVTETDEGNNTFVDFPITVLPANVEMSFVSMNIETNVVAAGESVAVAYTVQNTGTTQLQGYAQTSFFLSADQALDDSDVMLRAFNNDLQPGTSSITDEILIPIVTPGSYFIIGKVDHSPQDPKGIYADVATAPLTIQSPDVDLP